MKKILYILIPIALVGLVIGKLATNKKTAEERVYKFDPSKAVEVATMEISVSKMQPSYDYTGTLEPNRESKLSAEVQGKVNKVLVENGATVRRGQVLIQLDDALLQWQRKTAEVQVKGLERDLNRFRILVENDAVQGIQLEKTELALETAKIQINTLNEQINKCQIRAPFDGIVTAKLTEEGDFAAPGKPLLQLTDISKVKLSIQVSEKDLILFQLGQEYPIAIPSLNLEKSGEISLIGSRGNPANSFPVEITLANIDQKIKAGMFGHLRLQSASAIEGIVIPSSAIVGSDLAPQVFVIKDGKATLKSIVIQNRIGDQVLLHSGLQENEILITGGLINVFEGAPVTKKL
jgi:RND family efflux transporter MFP subunit